MESNERQYGYCKDCGNIVYRIPGKLHGDGQQDTDEHPVWLLGFENFEDYARETRDYDFNLPDFYCGCND